LKDSNEALFRLLNVTNVEGRTFPSKLAMAVERVGALQRANAQLLKEKQDTELGRGKERESQERLFEGLGITSGDAPTVVDKLNLAAKRLGNREDLLLLLKAKDVAEPSPRKRKCPESRTMVYQSRPIAPKAPGIGGANESPIPGVQPRANADMADGEHASRSARLKLAQGQLFRSLGISETGRGGRIVAPNRVERTCGEDASSGRAGLPSEAESIREGNRPSFLCRRVAENDQCRVGVG